MGGGELCGSACRGDAEGCRMHQGQVMTELALKKAAGGSRSEAGETLMLFVFFEDCQDLGPPYCSHVAVEMTDVFRRHCYALFLTAATSDPYLWCFVLFCSFFIVVFWFVFSPPAAEEKGDSLIAAGREMPAVTCPEVNTVSANLSPGSWVERGGRLQGVAEPWRWAGTPGDPLALPWPGPAQPELRAGAGRVLSYLQGWSLQNLPGQPVADHTVKRVCLVFFRCLIRISYISVCAYFSFLHSSEGFKLAWKVLQD